MLSYDCIITIIISFDIIIVILFITVLIQHITKGAEGCSKTMLLNLYHSSSCTGTLYQYMPLSGIIRHPNVSIKTPYWLVVLLPEILDLFLVATGYQVT